MSEEALVNPVGRSISGLKHEVLSFSEVLGQSVANIAPSATPALVIPLVFATAGNGTWLAYLFGTIAVLLVAASLNIFTTRSASPGSLYSFTARGLGPGAGVVSGWALVLAYVLCGSAVLSGFANYADVLLKYGDINVPTWILLVAGIVSTWFVAYKDIKLSTKLMLVFEIASLALIAALAVIVLVEKRFAFDAAQFSLRDVSFDGLRIGLVLAFFSFTGFESAAALGDEARHPLKTIPRALLLSAASIGLFFVVLSYTEVLGFAGRAAKLNEAQAPLADLATFAGVPFFGPLISLGALVSFWACTLACINAGARILFSMGRHNVFPAKIHFGAAHATNETPHIAVTVTSVVLAAVPIVLALRGAGLFDIYGWVGTIATLGFLFSYSLIAVAAPVYLWKRGEFRSRHAALAVATVVTLSLPIIGSVYPLPAAPYGYFPFIFLGWLAVAVVWYGVRKLHSSVVEDISDDLDKVHARFEGTAPAQSRAA